MSYFPELDDKTFEELTVVFDSFSTTHNAQAEEEELYLHEVAALIAQFGETGVRFLFRKMLDLDRAKLKAVLVGLTSSDVGRIPDYIRASIQAALTNLLGSQDPNLIAKSIDAITHFRASGLLNRILPLLHHASPFVVGSALRYLSRLYPEVAKPHLIDSLQSPQPIVRQNAIDELDDLECWDTIPLIRELLRDPDEFVRQAAQTAIDHFENNQNRS